MICVKISQRLSLLTGNEQMKERTKGPREEELKTYTYTMQVHVCSIHTHMCMCS